jgi:hypothetical protein
MEAGPPLGLAVLTRAAAAYSPDPVIGYPFALRTAATLLLVMAVVTLTSRPAQQPAEENR